ncbi:MAG: type II methionyl aminopeptidase [Candidatus Lokiarchaeota archaeon]|nr:type II methionyl aminopeptidase [Candidatus Lokiarchaeota archaeon]
MNNDYIDCYIKAGKAVIAAKKMAKKIVTPGSSFLDVANKCEDEILKNGAELSFPINMSLNEIAAHYSPPIDEPQVIPEKGLLKIDVGSHYKGYIADSAFTINLDEDPKLQNYIEAAEAGLNAAIDIFIPGTKLYELGEVIAAEIIKRGLRPVTNLGGHELKQYNLHAGPFIPNYKETTHNTILKPGDAYACEPFTTSGVGKVINGKNAYIFRFLKKKTKNLPYESLNYMKKIADNFGNLPFSPRWIEKKKLIPKNKIQSILNSFISKNIIDKYHTLIEKTSKPVAQFEHTIIIDSKGKTIVTTKE